MGNPEASPVIINGVKSTHCLGMHPPDKRYSSVKYRLGKNAQTFNASVALALNPGERANSPIVFAVFGDGKRLWSSKVVQSAGDMHNCDLDVSSVELLELRVYCIGNSTRAHAVWLDPYVLTFSPNALRKQECTNPVYLSNLQASKVNAPGDSSFRTKGRIPGTIEWITLNGVKSPNGIYMHPPDKGFASVTYSPTMPFTVFRAKAAILKSTKRRQENPVTPLIFEVVGDGKSLWQSKPLRQLTKNGSSVFKRQLLRIVL
jgi:hypothetical protein